MPDTGGQINEGLVPPRPSAKRGDHRGILCHSQPEGRAHQVSTPSEWAIWAEQLVPQCLSVLDLLSTIYSIEVTHIQNSFIICGQKVFEYP